MLQVVILMAVTLTGFLPNVVTLSCEDPPVTSDKLLTFMSMFNGKFEIEPNSELPLRSGYYYYRPVNVPALEPALSIFMEAKRNNKLVRRQLLAVTEEEDGSIHVQVYNFTETTVIRDDCDPMTVFAGLEMSDLTTKDECEIVVQQKRKSLFRGHWNNCRKSPFRRFDVTLRCNSLKWVESEKPQGRKRLRSTFHRTGERYPLLPFMLEGNESFQSPCTD